MRVMIDTNILISIMLSPGGMVSIVVNALLREHSIVIPSICLVEMEAVARRKWPLRLEQIDKFLQDLPYEFVRTPAILSDIPYIRDPADQPVLATAIHSGVDILLTGDKDFLEVDCTQPKILTPSQFAHLYLHDILGRQ